jgi:hypothetical protein
MRYGFIALMGVIALAIFSCKDNSPRYIDPNTGKEVTLVKDASTGLMVDAETKKPVHIYVDTEKKDTIYGETGKIINGHVKQEEGKYEYSDRRIKSEDGEYKIKGDDYKEKMEKDGDLKIKNGDTKTKVDGKTGEVKVKD